MIDPFGRTISYLRVSVTDRCDFRCVYCMAEEMNFLPKRGTPHPRGARPAVRRLYPPGCEKAAADRRRAAGAARHHDPVPLARPPSRQRRARRADPDHQRQPARPLRRRAGGMRRQAGQRLARHARPGEVRRDHPPRPARFRCSRASTPPNAPGSAVKINTVALRGVNEDELDDIVAWCGAEGFDLVLIEVMPMGDIGGENRLDQYLPLSLVRARAAAALDARRDRLPHRRPGALCDGARDRAAAGLHHAAHP